MNSIKKILKTAFTSKDNKNITPDLIKRVNEDDILRLIVDIFRDKELHFAKKDSIEYLNSTAVHFEKLSLHKIQSYFKHLSDLLRCKTDIQDKLLNYLINSVFGRENKTHTPMDLLYAFNFYLNLARDDFLKNKKIKGKHLVSLMYKNKTQKTINYDLNMQHLSSLICSSLKYFYGDNKKQTIFINEETSIDHNNPSYSGEFNIDFNEYTNHANTWCVSDFYFRRSFYFEDDFSNLIKKTQAKVEFQQTVVKSRVFLNMNLYNIPCPENKYLSFDTIHNYNFKKNKRNYANKNIYDLMKKQIQDILFLDIDSDVSLFNDLTLKEWCLGYIMALNVIKKQNTNDFLKFDKKFLAQELLDLGISDLKKSEHIINELSFSLGSKDLHDTPFIQSTSGCVYIFKPLTELLDPVNALMSKLGSIKIDSSQKGEEFEKFTRDALNSKGLKCIPYHSKILINGKKEDYEYDALFCIDDTLFVIECKNTFVSFSDMTKAYRIKKLIDNAVIQLNRLKEGVCLLKGKIEKSLGSSFSEGKIITIVLNCSPINYEKINDTYIISKASLLDILGRTKKNKFNATDFINELERESNHEETIQKIKEKAYFFALDSDSGIASSYMDIE
ncbi:nuclease-related domain-containing protein [Erwinia tasmaniensis]|uniref:NERD domain-containing protein n=1 Tax=Erwinia tasmaniensis (strain DSM 17950 / CFBP 7177 / CIP 109463 / NCPPB 4357 / Et1/99) TaxID=465817 RepID=B2VFG1_ERWT9|nr:nuclease-related domain-containing protein [Erwinia tasmaniensis]CAO96455.1 Conserved hypothetical protein [Erwinia tasmaniensis Et1/99]